MASCGEAPDRDFDLDLEELDEELEEPELPLNILDILLILSDFRFAIDVPTRHGLDPGRPDNRPRRVKIESNQTNHFFQICSKQASERTPFTAPVRVHTHTYTHLVDVTANLTGIC